MMVLDTPELYARALQGTPLNWTVTPIEMNTALPIWTLREWSIEIPVHRATPTPEAQRMIQEIRRWTGWSVRRTADIVGSTHTTITNAEHGRPLVGGHSGDLRQRLGGLHDLVQRVHMMARGNIENTAMLLRTAPVGGLSAEQELAATGDVTRAYLAVLDALRPERGRLMTGSRPRRDGPTTALHD